MITAAAWWSRRRLFQSFFNRCDAKSRRCSAGRRRPSARSSINQYQPGAGIGWHRDKAEFDEVPAVSLLAPCNLRFRRESGETWERASLTVEPRSAYLLSGPARSVWQHSIPALDRLRYSITLRTLVANARPTLLPTRSANRRPRAAKPPPICPLRSPSSLHSSDRSSRRRHSRRWARWEARADAPGCAGRPARHSSPGS